jgi:hypothetical protein
VELGSGGLGKPNPPSSVTNKAISDADALRTSLNQVKGGLPSGGQVQVDSYLHTVDQYEQSVRALVAGDYQAALGQLAGVADEFGRMTTGLKSLCSP